ncbi:hypothetical protein NC651_023820 [Populus alba x Populus x berolinensis]|nr:hypothetical protein NC651_023820 [Populus alba x Populus x berolinensis]
MMLLGQSTSPWEAFAELLAMGKTLEDFHSHRQDKKPFTAHGSKLSPPEITLLPYGAWQESSPLKAHQC